jgi:hypothetical protein
MKRMWMARSTIEVLFYQVLSLPFFIASILVLLLRDRILRANRKVTPRPEASMPPDPRAAPERVDL